MIRHWFNQLALRERRAFIIGTVILAGIFGYFMFWEPVVTARVQLKNIVIAQQMTLRWMQKAAIEVQQLRHQSRIPLSENRKQSLLSLIDSSTRQGILRQAKKRIEPKGEQEVRVNFEEVSFTELMRWLEQLHNQHQIQVSTISLEEQHIPDKVKVYLTLKIDS